MSIASRFAQIALPLAFAIALTGCATQSQQPPASQPAQAAAPPPLKLCPLPDTPPKELASKPGYVQYAVTVLNGSGRPVSALTQKDFEVTANDQSIPITFFRDDKEAMPASIVIIVDTSGSMAQKLGTTDTSKIAGVRDGIRGAIANLNACDEVAVLIFGKREGTVEPGPVSMSFPPPRDAVPTAKISLIQPFSTDHDSALKQIDSIAPYGQTPLYDSVDEAELLLQMSHYPNRAILLITDGIDNASQKTAGDVLHEVRENGVPLYVVGIGSEHGQPGQFAPGPFAIYSPDVNRLDVNALQDLAGASPGRVWIVSAIDKDAGDTLVTALASAAQSVGHAYTIGFVAPAGVSPKIVTTGFDQKTYVHAQHETVAVH